MERDEIDRISEELEQMLNMASDGEGKKTKPATSETSSKKGEQEREADCRETEPPYEETGSGPEEEESKTAEKSAEMEGEPDSRPGEDEDSETGETEWEEDDFGEDEELARSGSRRGSRRTTALIRPSDALLASFFVPVIIMIIIFAQRGIFPFGEESFLRTDMYHQYAPFFSEFQYKLTHGGSLLYSWDVGMGVNFTALYAYYLASPLNWLLVLCPKNLIIEFMTYMIVFKIGLCGLSFSYYLRRHCQTSDFGVAFFGIFYALSGYMAAYSWNIMWLDCILLFPLIMLGLERLVREKKCFLYCITLGLSILSNYYISIMICIFMVLYFAALLILEKTRLKDYPAQALRFSVFSLAAGGLAAVVLLPEIAALKTTASGKFTFPTEYDDYFSIFDMIARHIGNVKTEIGLEHWPNIYCGVAVLMLFLLYLGCRQISLREKAVYCGLLLIFFASFSINVLNFIWHGFHYPNSLPCRQSFIYIFLMLLVCYQAYMHLRETPRKHVAIAFWGAVCFVLLAQELAPESDFYFIVFYVALLFLAIYAGLAFLYQRDGTKNYLILLTLGVVAVEAAVNTTVTSVTTTSRTSYMADNEAAMELAEGLKPNSTFYRVEKVDRKTKNDGAWMNFPSVSLFSSTANADLSSFFKKLGCESSTNAYSITGSTPLVDSLFSVKYALYSEEAPDTGLVSFLEQKDSTYLYENAFTLPLGFVIPPDLEENWMTDLGNPADVQNDFARSVGALPVLKLVESEAQAVGNDFRFVPETPGDYYVYISNKNIEKVTAVIGGNTKSFNNVKRGYFLELGYIEAGTEVSLQSGEGGQDLIALAYRFSPEGLESVWDILNRSPLELTNWRDTEIGGVVKAEKEGLLYTSIPYDKGWTAYVDGEERTVRKVFDTFLGVEVPSGSHMVTLRYCPIWLVEGAWITAGSVAFLLLAAGVQALMKRRRTEREFIDRIDE